MTQHPDQAELKATDGICDWCSAQSERVWLGAYNVCRDCYATRTTDNPPAGDVERLVLAIEPLALLAGGGVNMNDPLSKWFRIGQFVEAREAQTAALSVQGGWRESDLKLALEWALGVLGKQEPGDSRAVSDEFVSAATILCSKPDEQCREILRAALNEHQEG